MSWSLLTRLRSKSELLRVVLMLRLRAKRARQAALRKAPDVIDYIDSPPAWAFTSSGACGRPNYRFAAYYGIG